MVKKFQDNDLNNNKLTNINSITINNNPTIDNHVTNKKYVDDSKGGNNILRFIETLENSLKLSVGKDTFILTK